MPLPAQWQSAAGAKARVQAEMVRPPYQTRGHAVRQRTSCRAVRRLQRRADGRTGYLQPALVAQGCAAAAGESCGLCEPAVAGMDGCIARTAPGRNDIHLLGLFPPALGT